MRGKMWAALTAYAGQSVRAKVRKRVRCYLVRCYLVRVPAVRWERLREGFPGQLVGFD